MKTFIFMKKSDLLSVTALTGIVLILYYPLFFSEYAYTDELVQLWLYKKGSGYNMFLPLGRNITDAIFNWLFSSIDTVRGITRLRLFSLFGWIVCIPAWYYILNRIIKEEKLPEPMAFFIVLFLVTSPAFSISVQWASCMELFIANTSGLVSGYLLYKGIQYTDGRVSVSVGTILLSILFGLISLFTYQNGFGCFFIPFFLQLTSQQRLNRKFWIAAGMSVCIFVVYYILFKYSIKINHIGASDRAGVSIDPGNKLLFFFTRPLASAFHFTFLFNELNLIGSVVYAILFIFWIGVTFFKRTTGSPKDKLFFFTGICFLLLLTYLPSLLVKEKYSSNRTLLALDIIVFITFFEMILWFFKTSKTRMLFVIVFSILFMINAWYNFSRQFLLPVKNEYAALRSYIENNYNSRIQTIYFIRPPENLFQKEYHITSSWDEFGVPSSFFEWVPEFFSRQVIFEKTNSRKLAEQIIIKNWLGKEDYRTAAPPVTDHVLVVDAEQIIKQWNNATMQEAPVKVQ